MKRAYKCASSFATAMLAVSFVAWAPASRAADDPPAASSSAAAQPAAAQPAAASSAPAQPASSSSASSETQQRLADLEKEIEALQAEITSLKESDTPGMKAAAYVEPASAPVSAPVPAPDDKISLASLLGPVTLSGFGDVYYGYNYNHPGDNTSGLRFFDGPTNGFGFNMAELILDKAADATSAESRLGYHISAGYGEAAKVVNGSDNPAFADGSNFYVKEAYVDYLAPVGKGLTITVGKFVTPFGAEVIETNANWNYSRSILFYYAIPYFHFGASAKYAFNSKWSLTGYLVNGWNNTIIYQQDDVGQSAGLTYGASLVWTPNAKWSVTQNYMAGPVVDAYSDTTKIVTDWKQLSDTVISYTPNAKWAFMLNGDYGFGPRPGITCDEDDAVVREALPPDCSNAPAVNWWGVAGYAKYTWTPKTNFAVRYEFYNDTDGYTGLLFGDPGHAQEVSADWSYNLTSALLIRGEYRYDFASEPIFQRGELGSVKEQNTATLGFIYSFSSANAK
jgi:Putative beta-barrel porin-2, OmpL-like. bbp2